MSRSFKDISNEIFVEHEFKRNWKAIASVLSCFVIAVTFFALTLPAVTLSGSLACGQEAHTHSAECYEVVEAAEEGSEGSQELVLICEKDEHEHSDDCYEEEEAVESEQQAVESEKASEDSTKATATVAEVKNDAPAQSFKKSAGDVTVTVEAEEGALSAGSTMKVKALSNEKLIEKAIAKANIGNSEAKAVDIAFYNAKGKEIEPQIPVRVSVKAKEFSGTEKIKIVHFEEGSKAEVVKHLSNQALSAGDKPAKDEVVFEAESFSPYVIVYTVDFHFGEYEYSLKGGESIMLSALLDELKIKKNEVGDKLAVSDVEKVSFSDEKLLKVAKSGEDWELKSLKEFTSEEKLTLVLKNGEKVVIEVTDAQMVVTGTTLTVNGTKYDLSTTSNIEIKETDSLEFLLNYEVPGGSLSAGTNTVKYQLPSGIKIREAITNRNITHGNEVVGTYSIDTNGEITFVYNDDYVTKNANGSKITADLSFSAAVNASNISDGGTVKISFSDNLEVDVRVEKEEVGDLSVYKQVDSNNYSDGYIVYRINVSSTNGTSSQVNLTDVITNSGLTITSLSDFIIEPNNNITPTRNGTSGFGLTLPAMDANSSYTITYRVNYDKTTVPLNGVSINNKITGESTANKGTKLTPSYEVDTNVKPNDVISKSVKNYDEDNNTVSWEIKINGSGLNLNGWTLKDTLNGAEYKGTVHVDPAIDGKNEITLPYTWNKDDRNTYTITYTTTADKLIGANSVVNKAELTKDDDSVTPGETHAGWTGDGYNPLSKDATNITANEELTEATVDWTVTISASKGPIAANWTYKDELWNGQWFTGTQLKAIKEAIDTALVQNGLSLNYTMKANLQKGTDGVGDEVTYEQFEDDKKYKVYTLYFTSEMPRGKSFTFTYQSIAPIEGLKEKEQFRNNAYIDSGGNKVYDNGSTVYIPPKEPEIIKTDGNESNDSSHDITSLNQVFKWNLKVTIPIDYNGTTLTVKEHLPAGVTLEDLEILAQGTKHTIFGATHFVRPQLEKNELTINGYVNIPITVTLTLEERTDGGLDATIVLPENLVKHEEISEVRFVVEVKPTNSNDWTKDGDGYLYKKFGNTVELIDKDNQTISSDSHDQTITLKDGKKLIGKSVGFSDNGKFDANIVPYSLKINEDGADLVEGADTITLTDVLKYEYNLYYLVNVAYSNNSLAVYRVKEDGTKGERLSSNEYSFTYEETIDYENKINSNPTAVRTLKVVLPDSTPLIVDYSYMVSDTNEAGRNTHLSNRAYLEGYNENRYSDEKNTYVEVQKSDAHASIEGITLQKVDADNFATKLEGVTFYLYKYDQSSNSYVKRDKTYTTDSSGNINFTSKDIDYETAYKLVEESTISGYFSEKAPYYFIVTDVVLQQGQSPSYIAPDDFDGTVYSVGASFYFKNRKIPEKGLSVSKVWKDYEGNVIEDASDMPEIKAKLLKDGEVIKTFTLGEDNGWTEIFNDLDAGGHYTVKEATELVGYKTPIIVYEQGDGEEVSYLVGTSYGTATITNQPNEDTPNGGSTNVAVTKKWVGEDGATELTGDDIDELKAVVKLVRYKIKQVEEAGTKLVFWTSNGPGGKTFAAERIVKQNSTIKIRLNLHSNYNNYAVYSTTEDITTNGWWNKQIKENGTVLESSLVTSGGEHYMEYILPVGTQETIYLWHEPQEGVLSERSDTVTSDNIAGLVDFGVPETDDSFDQVVTLSNSNDWSAVFGNLPDKGIVDDTTYAYTYAVKEVGCSDGFEIMYYSNGTSENDDKGVAISNTGNNITVTNKQKATYELPKTGGSGTVWHYAGGALLASAAGLALCIRRKRLKGGGAT